jgi:hypothetical protein
MRVSLFLLFVTFFLSGCATGPKMSEINSRIPAIKNENARIFIYRESIFVGDGHTPSIILNGNNIGDSIAGGWFFLDTVPGDYVLTTSTNEENRFNFQLTTGEERYISFKFSSFGVSVLFVTVKPRSFEMEIVPKDKALLAMKELRYTGPPF